MNTFGNKVALQRCIFYEHQMGKKWQRSSQELTFLETGGRNFDESVNYGSENLLRIYSLSKVPLLPLQKFNPINLGKESNEIAENILD